MEGLNVQDMLGKDLSEASVDDLLAAMKTAEGGDAAAEAAAAAASAATAFLCASASAAAALLFLSAYSASISCVV